MIKKQMGFYLDSTLCTGCKTCMIACKDKNDLKKGVNWRRVTEYTGGDWMKVGDAYQQNIFSYNLSISCNHCEEPICVENCPTTAMHKDEKTGIVSVNRNKCVGCRYCEWACPYGAPQYNSDLGIMTKCDLCFDYLEKGETPACVAACPNRGLSMENEWTLTIFTIIIQLGVGAIFMSRLVSLFVPGDKKELNRLNGLISLLTAPLLILALFLSLLHLGYPRNAPNSILNFISSPLSKEIIFVCAFNGLVCLLALMEWKKIGSESVVQSLSWVTALTGIQGSAIRVAALFSIILLGVELAIIPLSLLEMASGNATALASIKIINGHADMLSARVILGVLGAGVGAFLVYRKSLSSQAGMNTSGVAFIVLTLVLTSEIMGRLIFYASYVRVGILN